MEETREVGWERVWEEGALGEEGGERSGEWKPEVSTEVASVNDDDGGVRSPEELEYALGGGVVGSREAFGEPRAVARAAIGYVASPGPGVAIAEKTPILCRSSGAAGRRCGDITPPVKPRTCPIR